jgi:hypothetical protein
MKVHAIAWVVACGLFVAACGGEVTDVSTTASVPSGTYEGTITDITLGNRTLSVSTQDVDTLRAFFTDSTQVVNDSLEVGFGSLVEGEQIRITVQQAPERLETTRIEVLQSPNSPVGS